MAPDNALARALQLLPEPARKTLYSVLGLVGAVLAVFAVAGLEDLGPFTTTQALEVYAVLSAATGGVAFANVGRPATEETDLGDFDEDADLTSFEPVGLVSDVFENVPR
jgi:hypothetical protein